MSSSPLAAQETPGPSSPAEKPVSPFKSPTYLQRTHYGERPQLETTLRAWDEKVVAMARKLSALGDHPQRPEYERLYHQMRGALDEMAAAVRRMPQEAGVLYEEDRERLESAEAALARVFERWDGLKA